MRITLPDKTRLFLAALWVWTYILFWFNRLLQAVLKIILVWLPNQLTPTISYKTPPIRVLEARDGFGRVITNKLKLFINNNWDNSIAERGGVDLDMFCKYIGSSVIWVVYMFDYEIDNKYDEYITAIQNKKFTSRDMHGFIKTAIIDISNKIIKKFDNINEYRAEEIIFGEFDLH